MRDLLLTIMISSQVAAMLNALYQGNNLKNFLDQTPQLASSMDIENFKNVVGRQMWAALVQALLLIVAPAVYIWGLVTTELKPADFVFVLLPSILVILVAQSYRRIELRAWSLPAADEMIASERDRIVHIWRTKPFPMW